MRAFEYWVPQCANVIKHHKVHPKEFFFDWITTRFEYSIDGVAVSNKGQIAEVNDWLLNEYPDVELSEISDLVNDEVVVDGKSVNHVFVNITKSNLKKVHNLQDTKCILEIGAGYGALAREIMLEVDCKYVIIDLYAGLLCSSGYLEDSFPDKNHVFLEEGDPWPEDFDVLYLNAENMNHHKQLGVEGIDIDLCINTCSLGEMDSESIDHYYSLAEDLKINNFFWLNRYWPNREDDAPDQQMCYTKIPESWEVKYIDKDLAFYKAPGDIMNKHSIMAEIYLEIK